jgi:two-component system nitrate/nitrite response regulator NarL
MSGGMGATVGVGPDGLAGYAAAVGQGEIRVLLCDDAAVFRALMRHTLEEDPQFCVVGEASDGREGLEAVAALRPDVVLLDMSMPRLDGAGAIAAMRRASPQTRIVALSGFSAEDMADVALARGAHAYVEKGADMATIHDVVRGAAVAPDPTP